MSGIKIIDMIDVEALKAYAYDTIGAIHEVTQAASVRMRRKAGRLAAFLVQIKSGFVSFVGFVIIKKYGKI